MQRKEFENRIKSLLPKAADDVVESWAEYATELDQDGTEAAADFYDKNYIALLLVKQRRGEEICKAAFNWRMRRARSHFVLLFICCTLLSCSNNSTKTAKTQAK